MDSPKLSSDLEKCTLVVYNHTHPHRKATNVRKFKCMCIFEKHLNPDLTAKFSLCSPLHITWLQVFFHCFALCRLCYGPKSTWISAFLGGGGCSSSIWFHCATYSPWTTTPAHQLLCSAEVRDWSLAYSTSQPLWLLFYPNHRTWAFMANLFPPLPLSHLGPFLFCSSPCPSVSRLLPCPRE